MLSLLEQKTLLRRIHIYDENGEKIPGKFVKRGTKVDYLGHKEINEKPFVQIGDGEYVKALNVLTIMVNN